MPSLMSARAKNTAAATFVSLSAALLLLFVAFATTHKAFAVAAAATNRRAVLLEDCNDNGSTKYNAAAAAEHAAAVERHCAGTLHRDVCASTLATIPNLAQKPLRDVISDVVSRAARPCARRRPTARRARGGLRVRDRLALSDCLELFGHTLNQLSAAAAALSEGNHTAADSVAGVQTVLSAAMTNQYTCLDGFAGPSASEDGRVRPFIQGRIYHVAHLVSNSLAMLRRLPQTRRRGRGLLGGLEGYGSLRRGFPTWVTARDRRRLQAAAGDGGGRGGGQGRERELHNGGRGGGGGAQQQRDAAGGYFENVEVGSEKTNLMFVGDGMWKTVIKASRNVVDNSTTFRSATLAVVGTGFLARDLTVENAAGPSKHQAVALRVNADLSAFYRCSFAGYQDTLYTYSRTVFMQTKMESLVHPRGWLEWNGTFALDTLYYAEYMNRGPGANTSARVTWPGYHVLTNASDASNFTVLNFVQGDLWLNSSSFPYTLGLS
ncbi:hypothetical protein EJB05_10559, partial [Eragrostis curvula]